MPEVFHEGEQAVQRRAGVFDQAARLGNGMVRPALDASFAEFLNVLSFIVVASRTPDGHVWASVLMGPRGFVGATAADRIRILAPIGDDDPLAGSLAGAPAAVGVLALEAASRSRIRLNGIAHRTDAGLDVELREVFGNCPKYIQRRYPSALAETAEPAPARTATGLDAGERALVRASDTCFVASRHPERGADASHRGGPPGFVAAAPDGRSITLPDYQGNNMFQTLGNLTVDPAIGLLFIDWDTGRTLQVSGRAEIVWDGPRLSEWPKARRLVDVAIEAVVDRPTGSPVVWTFLEAHHLNPDPPAVEGHPEA